MNINLILMKAMKRIIMMTAALFAVVSSFAMVSCDKYDDGRPSKSVRNEFKIMYPDARDVEWEAEVGYWVVSFETGTPPLRLDHEAWYDADANWIKTVTDYPVSLVPQDIKDLLSSSEYGTIPLEDREVEFFETSSSGNFYRFDLRQGGREIKVDVHTNGAVTPAQYDMM